MLWRKLCYRAGSTFRSINYFDKETTDIDCKLSTGGGTSDARFIREHCPVVEFGLVGETMHQVNENTSVDDIILLKDIYKKFLKNYNKKDKK